MKTGRAIALLAAALLVAAYSLLTRDNFHAVVPGEVYRSAQLSGSALQARTQAHGIRTVISLREPRPGEGWYRQELSAAEELGIAHHDVGMFSTAPRVDQLLALHALLEGAERPLLVHCRGGYGRTSLAAAMAALMADGAGPAAAQEQLHWRYGLGRDEGPGRAFVEAYRRWLAETDTAHSPAVFARWLSEDYRDPTGNVHFLVHPIADQTWYRPDGGYAEGERFVIRRAEHDYLDLDGWAFDTRRQGPLQGLTLRIGEREMSEVYYGLYTPWLVEQFGTEAYRYAGWAASQPLDTLADGCHDLRLSFRRRDGGQWDAPPAARLCIE